MLMGGESYGGTSQPDLPWCVRLLLALTTRPWDSNGALGPWFNARVDELVLAAETHRHDDHHAAFIQGAEGLHSDTVEASARAIDDPTDFAEFYSYCLAFALTAGTATDPAAAADVVTRGLDEAVASLDRGYGVSITKDQPLTEVVRELRGHHRSARPPGAGEIPRHVDSLHGDGSGERGLFKNVTAGRISSPLPGNTLLTRISQPWPAQKELAD